MFDKNSVTLRGNTTARMEVGTTPGGTPTFSFCLATNKNITKKDGEKEKRTTFHNVIAYGKLAEICQKIIKKGKKFEIEGEINNRTYKDKDGKNCYWSEVVINRIEDMSSRYVEDKTV